MHKPLTALFVWAVTCSAQPPALASAVFLVALEYLEERMLPQFTFSWGDWRAQPCAPANVDEKVVDSVGSMVMRNNQKELRLRWMKCAVINKRSHI